MKVENTHNNSIIPKQAESTNPVEKSPHLLENERMEKLDSKDQASLSERAKLLAAGRAQINKIQDIRADKVNELRAQVEAGTYLVPFEKLAKVLATRIRIE
jgi:flagellar biosynthesis anti-sigma factor FlgM